MQRHKDHVGINKAHFDDNNVDTEADVDVDV